MVMARRAFAALICTVAIGSFVIAGVWFPDLEGASILLAGFPLLSFALVGTFLVLRRAGDPIGWLLGAAGALLQLGGLANSYGYASLDRAGGLPAGDFALWFGAPGAVAAVGLAVTGLTRFPDGRPPGRVRHPAVGLRRPRRDRPCRDRARRPADRGARAARG